MIIALGFGIIINKLYGEQTTNGQLITVVFIAIVAILFFMRIVKNLSVCARNAWLLNLVFTVIVITMPTAMLKYTTWFSIFLMNAIGNFATDIYEYFKAKPEMERKNLKLSPKLFAVGLFVALGELVFMYANPILGVTTVLVIKRASIPFVMIVSNFLVHKNEDKKFDNIVFAVLAGLMALLYFITAQ